MKDSNSNLFANFQKLRGHLFYWVIGHVFDVQVSLNELRHPKTHEFVFVVDLFDGAIQIVSDLDHVIVEGAFIEDLVFDRKHRDHVEIVDFLDFHALEGMTDIVGFLSLSSDWHLHFILLNHFLLNLV